MPRSRRRTGFAGFRVGYGIATERVADYGEGPVPFSVNLAGQVATASMRASEKIRGAPGS